MGFFFATTESLPFSFDKGYQMWNDKDDLSLPGIITSGTPGSPGVPGIPDPGLPDTPGRSGITGSFDSVVPLDPCSHLHTKLNGLLISPLPNAQFKPITISLTPRDPLDIP